MLITTTEELEAIYPTSRWDRISKLIPLFVKTERTRLAKYLGMPLLQLLNEQYKELCEDEGGITALHIDDEYAHCPPGTVHGADADAPDADASASGDESEEPTMCTQLPLVLDVLRTCQEVIVYITLSNNVRILTSSLNQGGGFNTMTTDDYDQSSDTQLKALSQELWRNAMDSLESLLLLLETDALSTHLYTDLWKQSRYYYYHQDLIFRTADEMSQYSTLDGGRERFIAVVPGIRNAQNQYITTRIGEELTKCLVTRSWLTDKDATAQQKELFELFARHVRLALANYVAIELLRQKASSDKNSTQSRARSEMGEDYHIQGDREIALALDVVFQHADLFGSYITDSAVLQYEYQRATHQAWQAAPSPSEPSAAQADCDCHYRHERPQHDSVCDLGGWHVM